MTAAELESVLHSQALAWVRNKAEGRCYRFSEGLRRFFFHGTDGDSMLVAYDGTEEKVYACPVEDFEDQCVPDYSDIGDDDVIDYEVADLLLLAHALEAGRVVEPGDPLLPTDDPPGDEEE